MDIGIQPEQIIFKDLRIFSTNLKKFAPLGPYLAEPGGIQLFEDIRNSHISGHITLSDSDGLIEKFPIIGEELIVLTYNNAGFPDNLAVDILFRVNAITTRASKNSKTIFTMEIISYETIADINMKESRAYSGSGDQLVKTIFDELGKFCTGWIPSTLNFPEPKLLVEPTSNQIKFISNFWTPLRRIAHVTKSSLNKNMNPSFLFFRTTQTYAFLSMDTLKTPDKNAPTLYYSTSEATREMSAQGGTTQSTTNIFNRIKKVSFVNQFNQSLRHETGVLAGLTVEMDVLRKRVLNRSYSYAENFANAEQLNPIPYITENNVLYGPGFVQPMNGSSYAFTGEVWRDEIPSIMPKRVGILGQLDMGIILDIEIVGRCGLTVGQQLNLVFPAFDTKYYESPAGAPVVTKANRILNGRYLIIGIAHSLTSRTYSMNVRVMKDTFI